MPDAAPTKTAETLVPRSLRTRERPFLLAFTRPLSWVEDATVLLVSALATLRAEWRILSDAHVFQEDAQIHEYWMRRFQDPALFDDPLTNGLLDTGYSPPLFRFLYWLASHVLDPVVFGELLPLVLQPLAVWLVFRIVRAHVAWRPAAWVSAALFLVPWEIHRFSGGHPRAFAQPIVLLAVLLLLRRRNLAAALVPPVGLLLYPPAGLVALAVVLLAALELGQPLLVNRTRAAWAVFSGVGFAAVALTTRLLAGSHLISAEEARGYPEFGPNGQMHYFAPSTLASLQQNHSGFFLQEPGSILAVTALFLLLVRPRNATLLRWDVWCVPIASLALFGAAHALLFRLYLPHRYTYALLPFFCVVIGIALRPTLEAWGARKRLLLWTAPAVPLALALLALTVFPLGPQLSLSGFGSWLADAGKHLAAGLALGLLLAGIFGVRRHREKGLRALAVAVTLVAGMLLFAEVRFAGGGVSPGTAACRHDGLYRHLRTLPKDAIIAGDPFDLNCIPIAAERPVVISTKLYQPWERDYFQMIRGRMFAAVEASHGSSFAAIVDLRNRYGADYFLVRTAQREGVWRRMKPFTGKVRRLRDSDDVRAALRLPRRCETWSGESFAVYSLACVASEGRR